MLVEILPDAPTRNFKLINVVPPSTQSPFETLYLNLKCASTIPKSLATAKNGRGK